MKPQGKDRVFSVRLHYENLPDSVNGAVALDSEDPEKYTILVNQNKSEDAQREAFLHEMLHIYRRDFESGKTVDQIEREVHGINEEKVYNVLEKAARSLNYDVIPFDFNVEGLPEEEQVNGAICGDKIGIEQTITDPKKKAEILAHEIGHAILHKGDLITNRNPKYEEEADRIGNLLISIINSALEREGSYE